MNTPDTKYFTVSFEDATPHQINRTPVTRPPIRHAENTPTKARLPLRHILNWIQSKETETENVLNSMRKDGAERILVHARLPVGKDKENNSIHAYIRDLPATGILIDNLKKQVSKLYREAERKPQKSPKS